MPRKGITGHDEWVITEALATALIALEQLPPQHQPRTHMDDIRRLLAAGCEPETLALHLAQAKCRLFPDLDRPTISSAPDAGPDLDYRPSTNGPVIHAWLLASKELTFNRCPLPNWRTPAFSSKIRDIQMRII